MKKPIVRPTELLIEYYDYRDDRLGEEVFNGSMFDANKRAQFVSEQDKSVKSYRVMACLHNSKYRRESEGLKDA